MTASPSSSPSVDGELELLDVAALSHKCLHPDGFPSPSVPDGNDRLARRLEMKMNGRPVGDELAQAQGSY
jgi:hypothetical protein